jgi:predicted exporter
MSNISEDQTYLYQQRYSSPIQYGIPDTSQQTQKETATLQQETNTNLKEAASFQSTQTSEVTPEVQTPYNIDLKV